MAKGYWIAHVDVRDPDAYRKYVQANADAFAEYGARFLVRGGTGETPEGTTRSRTVVIEFPDHQSALDCYQSPEYRHAMTFRAGASTMDLVIIEGYEGPQPGDG